MMRQNNKIIILLFFIIVGSFFVQSAQAKEFSFPRPVGYVNDFAGVIPAAEESQLNVLIEEVGKKTGTALVVVTVPTVSPLSKEEYAVKLYKNWGIGKKGEDKGALILISLKEREWKIETGYGTEGVLPDIIVSEIGRKIMVPYFREGAFGKGILAGTQAIASRLAEEYHVQLDLEGSSLTSAPVPPSRPSVLRTILTLIFFIFIFGTRMGLFGFLFLGRPGYWSGGHSGTGGFGGGFGSFGGGLSGGGGAGGSW